MNLYLISQTENQGYDTYDTQAVANTKDRTIGGKPRSRIDIQNRRDFDELGQLEARLTTPGGPGFVSADQCVKLYRELWSDAERLRAGAAVARDDAGVKRYTGLQDIYLDRERACA